MKSVWPLTAKFGVWKGTLGIWKRELAPPAMKAEPRVLVDDAGDLGQPVPLVGVVVNRRKRRGRVLDAETVVDVLAGREIVDRAGAAAVGEGGLRIVARAAGDGGLGAGVGRAGFQGDVDDARGVQAVLGRQGAGEQRHLVGVARGQDVVEQRQALGQLHAVEPVLHVAVVAAHVDLAETVLHHAGRAQQHLVQGRVLALRDVLDDAVAEIVDRGAEAGLDGAARFVEPRRRDGDAERRIGERGLRLGLRGGRRHHCDQARDQRQMTDMPPHGFPHKSTSREEIHYNISNGQLSCPLIGRIVTAGTVIPAVGQENSKTYLRAATPAWDNKSSCAPEPPLTPMAPTTLPPTIRGLPPREAITSSSVVR